MARKFYLMALPFFAAIFIFATAANAAIVFFELAGETNIAPGDLNLSFDVTQTAFSLDVYISIDDSEDGDGLYTAWHSLFVDDTAIAGIDTATLNTTLWDPAYSDFDYNSPGDLDAFIEDYFDDGQPYGYLLLETVDFTLAQTEGTANLTMDFYDPAASDNFVTWNGDEIDNVITYDSATVTVGDPVPGDIDGNGTADLADALIALRALAGMDVSSQIRDDYPTAGVDVNGDAVIGIQEAIYTLQRAARVP
jgi:hypothetical protein